MVPTRPYAAAKRTGWAGILSGCEGTASEQHASFMRVRDEDAPNLYNSMLAENELREARCQALEQEGRGLGPNVVRLSRGGM